MSNEKSVSFNTLMDKINPLNLRDNYNDCVIAFKILLNLSDNDEVRNLGQQIVDSFLLLQLLNSYSKLKYYFNEYSILCDKLYLFVNRYSQFEKLLRKNEVKTKACLISDNDDEENEIINSDRINVFIEGKQTNNNYPLNDIIKTTNIFRIILCKDNENRFKSEIVNKIRSNNLANTELFKSDDTREITKRKKNILVNTIISNDDISDNQTDLFNNINDKYKKLMNFDKKSYILEKFLEHTMTHLFVLDPDIAKIYVDFKDKCKSELENAIKERQILVAELNSLFDDYEKKYKNYNNIINDLYDNVSYDKIYSDYILNEEKESNNFDAIDFLNYVKKNSFNAKNEIIDEFKDIYVQFLINKLGNDNSIDFKDFINLNHENIVSTKK